MALLLFWTLPRTMFLPPLVAVLLALFAQRRELRDGPLAFLMVAAVSALIFTAELEFVYWAVFFGYSLWRQPGRLELWLFFAFIGTVAAFCARDLWKELR
jgi:hypothetical protein